MDYCPSQGVDRYFGDDSVYCVACGAGEQLLENCEHCDTDDLCSVCGYCPQCNPDREFSVLPENYFYRTCGHCKQSMNWQDISVFSEAISGEPVAVHKECLQSAKTKDKAISEEYDNYMKDCY